MFEHIVIRRSAEGDAVTVGQIAEAMFYYQKVQLFLDFGTVIELIRQIGSTALLALLYRHEISAAYCEETLGTHTEPIGVLKAYRYLGFAVTGSRDVGTLKNANERLQYRLEAAGVPRSDARKFVDQFFKRVTIRKLTSDHFIKGGVAEAAQSDLVDAAFMKQAIRHAVISVGEGFDPGSDFGFEVINEGLGNFIFTDINFQELNRKRAQASRAPVEDLTIANILTSVLDARADLAIASHYGGDFVTSQLTSSIIQVRHAEFLRRTQLNSDARHNFSEIVLPNTLSIAEIIDSRERSINDFFRLLDQAAKFKEWLKTASPDEGLIKAYITDISKESFAQSIPAKVARYVLATAIGAQFVSWVPGAAAGFVDTFLVEPVFTGWRPNHFVKRKLTPFLTAPK